MERRAKRKDGEDTMTAAKAMKPKGGADVCLATEGSTPNTTLMQRALARENLQRLVDRVSLPGCKSVRDTCRVTVHLLNRRMRTRKSGGVGAGS